MEGNKMNKKQIKYKLYSYTDFLPNEALGNASNYSTEQLIKFSEDIFDHWNKTKKVKSLIEFQRIERELVKRENDDILLCPVYNINNTKGE
tara:strand:- start:3204 stop:3476 length:273 start_codon:yes stop_codon:yes gene_type:complete